MIESNFVSPPSSVGWPPRSRTLSSPSQRRSRLRCNGCELDASERGRCRAVDAHVDESARRARPGEVDGCVAPCSPAQQRGVRPARPLDENLLGTPDAFGVPVKRNTLDDLHEPLDAFLLDLLRNLVLGSGRLGPLPRRVDERERAVVGDVLHDLERLFEVALGLAREADDDVGREREVGDRGAKLADEAQVALAAIRAAHRLEDTGRARLEREVRVLADRVTRRHRSDDVATEILRMRAREADALDPVDGVDRAQELGETAAEVPSVRIDVLPEESDLADAFVGQPRHFAEDLTGAPAHLAATDRRHDAVRAHRVAAHRDLHPGLETAFAVHRERPGELALLADPESATRRVSPGAEPLSEVRDRARPEGDVDEGVQLEEPLALGLRVAAAHRDHLLRVGELEHLRVAEMRGEPLIRLLADRARVEDEDVRLFLRDRLPQSQLLEHALDALGIVGVHLAPERRDVVPPHRAGWYPRSTRETVFPSCAPSVQAVV